MPVAGILPEIVDRAADHARHRDPLVRLRDGQRVGVEAAVARVPLQHAEGAAVLCRDPVQRRLALDRRQERRRGLLRRRGVRQAGGEQGEQQQGARAHAGSVEAGSRPAERRAHTT